MKRIVCNPVLIGAVAAGIVASVAFTFPAPAPSAIERMQASSVRVEFPVGGSGSGVVVSPDGLVLTNSHVCSMAGNEGNLSVTFSDDRVRQAKVLWATHGGGQAKWVPDLCLAKVVAPGEKFVWSPLGSREPELLDDVVVIGEWASMRSLISRGYVSGLNVRSAADRPGLRINARAGHGSSGSPVFNSDGEIVGLIYAGWYAPVHGLIYPLGTSAGVMLAVPLAEIEQFLRPLGRAG